MKLPKALASGAEQWLDAVAGGQKAMSQRSLKTISRYGGIARVRRFARKRQIHLLALRDEQGREIIAASKAPFRVIC